MIHIEYHKENVEKCLKLWYNEIRKLVSIYEIQHYNIQIK